MEMRRHGHGYGQGHGLGLDKDKAMGKDMARMIFCNGTYCIPSPHHRLSPGLSMTAKGSRRSTSLSVCCILLQGTFSSGSPVSVSMSLSISTSVSMSISMFLYKYTQVQVHILIYVHVKFFFTSTVPVHIHVHLYVFVHNDVVPVPDRRSRIIPEVVLVRRWAVGVLEIWGGEVLGEGWDKGGSVYKQPETEVDNSCHS
jgi:hypothetical protein